MSDPNFTRAIELLTIDVSRTLGAAHAEAVARHAAFLRETGLARPDKLVENVQQEFHDTFVDTAWPACPRHRPHPLWYRDGTWWCEAEQERIAPLGGLAAG